MSYDNWKLSNPIDDRGDDILVSSCCGDDYEENVIICGDCGSYEVETKTNESGDEFLTFCKECNSVENEDYIDYVCFKCDEPCDAMPLWDYKQKI